MSDRACSPNPIVEQQKVDTDIQVKEEESISLPSPTASVAPTETNPRAPSSSPIRPNRTSEGQRRAALRNDPQVEEMEPRRVLCRLCQKWIRLSTTTNYSLGNWLAHKQRCRGSPPSQSRRAPSKPSFSPASRVATTERRIALSTDPQVRECSPRHVQCRSCKAVVELEGELDYDLTRWNEHKENCIPMAPITPSSSQKQLPPPSTTSTHSHISAGGSPGPPTPAGESSLGNSTEATAVTESSPVVGVKRGREEESEVEEDVEDVRPTNRPRTETYAPPANDAPSVFGWLMRPLNEFARGFREGMGVRELPSRGLHTHSMKDKDLATEKTAAELAREKRLRDDPMADVHGPLFVSCRRCGSRIKLSPKSSYDPFHWMKHRERCLRRFVARRSSSTSPPAKKSPASSPNTDSDITTPPPLTPDDTSDVSRDRSLSPNIDDLDLSAKHVHVPLVDRWQTWHWSELRPPVWLADALSDEDCDDVEPRFSAPRFI